MWCLLPVTCCPWVHKCWKRNVAARTRRLVRGTWCGACGLEFHTRARLIRHLGVQHACTDFLHEAQGLMTDEEVAEEEDASKVTRKACQKEGVDVLQAYLPAVRRLPTLPPSWRDRRSLWGPPPSPSS